MVNYGIVSTIVRLRKLNSSIRFGRDNFQEAMKIAGRADHDKIDWNSFRFMVFDVPTSKGSYSERYQQLRMFPFP